MSDFAVSRQLCVALHSASRAMTARYRLGLAPLGLTYSQYMVMLVMWEYESVTMRFVARQTHLEGATLSPLLKRLETQGLIVRRRGGDDERTLELTITARGRELYEPVKAVQASVERDCELTSRQLAEMRDDIQRLSARLRDAVGRAAGGTRNDV